MNKIYNKKGFGLIEILVAISIFTIAMLGIIPLLINYMRTNVENEIRNNANIVVQKTIDDLKNTNLGMLDNKTENVTYGDWLYNVKWELIDDNASFNIGIDLVKIIVTWQKPFKNDNETLEAEIILGK
ncbi:MAG: type II secretion system protein [Deferribacterales bacterium]|nr:type II secretion system protein [Deferribacterales bacterium]